MLPLLIDKKWRGILSVLCHVKLTQHKKEYVLAQFEKNYDFARGYRMFPRSGDYDYILKFVKKYGRIPKFYGDQTHNFTTYRLYTQFFL